MRAVTAVVVGQVSAPPDQVEGVLSIPSLAELSDAASSAPGALLWVVGAASRPGPDTLQPLLDFGHLPVASLPVDERGAPLEAAIGRYRENDPGVLLEAAQSRSVPLRYTEVHSLLVTGDDVLATGPPEPSRFGAYAGLEWTGRLFARRPGMLVPASRIRVGEPAPRSPVHALRAARASGWGIGETLRELQRCASG